MRINTNIPALQSYNALTNTNTALQKSISRLSTGLRINTAADDAAGLAISEKMRAQYRGLDQASSNAQDGISMIQTAEGALNETHSILQRMRELSVQAANDTLTQEDRSYIQLEVDQLKEEITRISNTTQFNKKQLLDGSAAAVWSSDNLETKAIVNGGLRSLDQFGQKVSFEGNFKISIQANPGQAQVQKSDIFKIKHKNVIMSVFTNDQAGVDSVRVDNLPAGRYTVTVTETANGVAQGGKATMVAAFGKIQVSGLLDGAMAQFKSAGGADYSNVNMSVLFEVTNVNAATANGSVTFSVRVMGLDTKGNTVNFNAGTVVATSAGVTSDFKAMGLSFKDAFKGLKAVDTDNNNAPNFEVGAKAVFSIGATLSAGSKVPHGINVVGQLNDKWDGAWVQSGNLNADNFNAQIVDNADKDGAMRADYNMALGELSGKEVHFKQFYLNSDNGTVYEGDIAVGFNDKISGAAKDTVLASFEAAYIGQIAKGDVQLRDLDKFWDANGKFMLDDPKTLQIVQGDGKSTSVTMYSTDTLEDVRKKLNDAIAVGLGQGVYTKNNTNSFVSFVEQGKEKVNTSESVAGTMVVRSLVPGAAGKINFSGDEDIIKAFSLNQIQESKESQYTVSIADAHTGNSVASSVKVTGNKLIGILHENVDVQFDSMANIEVQYNEEAAKFNLKQATGVYETVVHISDSTTVFQIGANEGEDMGVNIGNMSADALGVSSLLVTDRESAARSITIIDNAINKVSSQRAKLGAYQNRLEHTINNLTTASTNLKSSESRIRDADMAKEMMNFTKLNILSQAGNSMLAQANQLPQNVLSLLR